MGGANCTYFKSRSCAAESSAHASRLLISVEVWKFGFYTLFPLATLYYFSDDDWYNKHVVPVSPFHLSHLPWSEDELNHGLMTM